MLSRDHNQIFNFFIFVKKWPFSGKKGIFLPPITAIFWQKKIIKNNKFDEPWMRYLI